MPSLGCIPLDRLRPRPFSGANAVLRILILLRALTLPLEPHGEEEKGSLYLYSAHARRATLMPRSPK
jgi:hypothetical protein